MILILAGLPGSDKSTVGTLLAKEYGALFSDVDDFMPSSFKKLVEQGKIITEDLYDEYFF